MSLEYPHESLGSTLLEVDRHGEYRRVFVRAVPHGFEPNAALEVGELTRGELTQEVYGVPVHYHYVHLGREAMAIASGVLDELLDMNCSDLGALLARYFEEERQFLADLMDDLDEHLVPYGYLSNAAGSCMSYRPSDSLRALYHVPRPAQQSTRRPTLQLV